MQVDLALSQSQLSAIETLSRPDVDSVLFGGSRGPGKTTCGCIWMYLACLDAIRRYKLRPSAHPPALGLMARKRSVDFTSTTLETWRRVIPAETYEHYAYTKTIVIAKTVRIRYGGLDNTESVHKFLSAEYCYIFLDQAEEVSKEDLGMLRSTLNRYCINGSVVPGKMLLTGNPPFTSLRDDYIKPGHNPRNVYIRALPTDNPFIDTQLYISTLQEAWKHRPELLRAYIYGEDVDITGNTIITRDMVDRCKTAPPMHQGKGIIAVDPAWDRPNSDETAIVVYIGNRPAAWVARTGMDTTQTAAEVMRLAEQYKVRTIVVDVCGLGAGVYDTLKRSYDVIACNSGSAQAGSGVTHYANTKSWMWHTAAQAIAAGHVVVPDDQQTIDELTAVTYTVQAGGKLAVEGKDSVRAKLGRSTNRADAVVMAIAYLPRARYTAVHDTQQQSKTMQPKRVY